MTLNHNIYIAQSKGWFDFDRGLPLSKVGSSQNVPARIKSYKTGAPYPVTLYGYFTIHNFNCYKLDNIIKIHLNNYRAKLEIDYNGEKLKGGTEFYYEVNEKVLSDLFYLLDIRFDWIPGKESKTEALIQEVSEEDVTKEMVFESEVRKHENEALFDFDNLNILLSPVSQDSDVRKNYEKTITKGVMLSEAERDKYKIKSTDKTLMMWSTRNSERNSEMKINDVLFLTIFNKKYGNYVDIFKVREVVKSEELSEQLWGVSTFEIIFVLDKIKTVNILPTDFFPSIGHPNVTTNLQGNIILRKDRQRNHMNALLNFIL